MERRVPTAEWQTKPRMKKRSAWIFYQQSAPTITDVLAGRRRSRDFWRHVVTNNFWNVTHLLVHFGLKLLPMDACSNFGASLGSFAMPRFHRIASNRARDTIRQLCPDMGDRDRDELFRRNCRAQGRLMTEFSVVNRLQRHPERVEVHGLDIIAEAVDRGPVILVGMHLGNWEITPTVLHGINVHAFYVPPRGRAKAWIAERVRRKAGLRFLPPGAAGVKPAIKILKDGGVVSIFCDEGFGGKIRGPFFGRKPHLEGNIGVAIRLARVTGATICPWYCLRGEGFNFVWRSLDPIRLPPEDSPGARRGEDLLLLNDVVERVIRENLDQWYFLDHALRAP